MSAGKTFKYSTWSGAKKTIKADSVEFGPAHVVFRDNLGMVLLAERVEQVNELREEGAR